MKQWTLAIFLLLSGCSEGEITKTVHSPEGVTAEIIESKHGASAPNKMRVALVSADGAKRINVFNGRGGSHPNVFFQNKMVVIQYCHPSDYDVSGYLYSLGDDYRFSDVRITAATVESQIGSLNLCQEDKVK